jgi:hypothetical protein
MKQEQWDAQRARDYFNKKKTADADAPRLKYGNRYTEVDGIKFQSAKEAEYYGQLKLRRQIGQIKDFRMQVVYDLYVNGFLITTYRADFVIVHPNGTTTVVDVKGKATANLPEFRMKRALMKACHGIDVQIV